MPEPNSPAVNPILSNIAIQYRNADFIADLVMPRIPVVNKSGRYQVYNKPDRFTIRDTTLAPKAEAKEVDWAVGEAAYACKGYALKDFVSDDEIGNAASPVTPLSDTVETLQDLMNLDREKRVQDLLVASCPGANAAAKWNVAGTDVIGDINNAIQQCFAPPNTVVMSFDVLMALDKNTDIKDRIKYTNLGVLTSELLASLFKVQRVIIGKSKYNTAKRGQTPVFGQVWTDSVYVAYINPRPSPKSLTLGLSFAETLFGAESWRVRSWREEKRGLGGGTEVQTESSLHEVLVASDVAYAIKDVL